MVVSDPKTIKQFRTVFEADGLTDLGKKEAKDEDESRGSNAVLPPASAAASVVAADAFVPVAFDEIAWPAGTTATWLRPPRRMPKPEPSAPGGGREPAAFLGLFHNLADDVKHLPRRNSLILPPAALLALAVHPADGSVNRHFLGSGRVGRFFVPAKSSAALAVQSERAPPTASAGRADRTASGTWAWV